MDIYFRLGKTGFRRHPMPASKQGTVFAANTQITHQWLMINLPGIHSSKPMVSAEIKVMNLCQSGKTRSHPTTRKQCEMITLIFLVYY